MSDLHLNATLVKYLKELTEQTNKDIRDETLAELLKLRKQHGVKTVEVRLPDGAHVADLTLPTPNDGIDIDDRAFMAWTKANHPTEVVEAVRESFRRAVVSQLVTVGEQVLDKRTGEVVPWASARPAGDPTYFNVQFASGGRDHIAAAWRDGTLELGSVLREIEAP